MLKMTVMVLVTVIELRLAINSRRGGYIRIMGPR